MEHIEITFPRVYKRANAGISPFVSEMLDNNEVKLPMTKHAQNPYHRCVHVSDGIHPSSWSKREDIFNWPNHCKYDFLERSRSLTKILVKSRTKILVTIYRKYF